ncbi:HupE/UreJ family protein [Stutzerimonas stutzeri]|jgi:urease accessory protein|uniref:HupE/UreJ family protein n=1 Tax=Stutzerimonas stutzeri subgroup TaxID=578833 RepID=UPI001F2F8859|nr:HupE/UreJ family protein [Stutzerimonas kunmingensis]UIP31935.1 HupE/UreJ family protein [Stutzerimonas kunmingensis]
MRFPPLLPSLGAAALVFMPSLAFAHPGHAPSGLVSGIAHPLGGLDHLLTMLAVGLWAAQQQGSARYLVPLTFLASMLLGGGLGLAGLRLPYLETGIAGSVLGLGLLVAVAARVRLSKALAITALFAFAHGLAHGLEGPVQSAWSYVAGFMLATAVLHAVGYALVRQLPRAASPLVRLAGLLSAAAGAWLLVSG